MSVRIRLIARGDGKFQVMAEQASRKGKRATAGKVVPQKGVREETARLVSEIRGENL
jgi:hypothetical protein